MLCLKWHFRNDEKEFYRNKFKSKSSSNPRNKDAAVEIYLSSSEEKLMNIEIPENKCNNLPREERSALYNLENDKSVSQKVSIRVPQLASRIGMVILKRLRNTLEIKIFRRRWVKISDIL